MTKMVEIFFVSEEETERRKSRSFDRREEEVPFDQKEEESGRDAIDRYAVLPNEPTLDEILAERAGDIDSLAPSALVLHEPSTTTRNASTTFGLSDALQPAKDEAMLLYRELAAFLKTLAPPPPQDRGVVVDSSSEDQMVVYSEQDANHALKGLRIAIVTSLQSLKSSTDDSLQSLKRSADGIAADDPALLEGFLLYTEIKRYLQPSINQASIALQSAGSEMTRSFQVTRAIVSERAAFSLAAIGPATRDIMQQLEADPAVQEARLIMADTTFPNMSGIRQLLVADPAVDEARLILADTKSFPSSASFMWAQKQALLKDAAAPRTKERRSSSPVGKRPNSSLVGMVIKTSDEDTLADDDVSYEGGGLVGKDTIEALDAFDAVESPWSFTEIIEETFKPSGVLGPEGH